MPYLEWTIDIHLNELISINNETSFYIDFMYLVAKNTILN